MKLEKRLTLLVAGGLLAAACTTTAATTTEEETAVEQTAPEVVEAHAELSAEEVIRRAVAGEHRTAENRARDAFRHPAETLSFFGLEPTMTVVELSPGMGWYTEILAPVLRDEGKLVIGHVQTTDPEAYAFRLVAGMNLLFEAHPQIFDRVEVGTFMLPDNINLGEAGSADMVLTFRSTHGWVNNATTAKAFGAAFEVLKPGGVLGLVQHRADAEVADVAESSKKGYLPEKYVIELAQAAGFELVERSDINANPRDNRDHPDGVWSLLPSLRNVEESNREQYVAIGESDRMTLKFRKPGEQASAE
ncbi:MAG: class I SAM-dependent methyltransferase [Bradymonadaceae bacterium]|nr:class I SAM-dependent methyltransferase [Lujinxingiaceae bacterium]